jgi:AraC-like DNA-binding protein
MKVQRLKFSSPGSAAGATEAMRLGRWWDEFRASLGGVELTANLDVPFAATVEYLPLGAFGLNRAAGSVTRAYRGAKHAARDGDDRFQLLINRGDLPAYGASRSWQVVMGPGSALLFDYTEEPDHICPTGHRMNALSIPRRLLRQAMQNAEDKTGAAIPPDNGALRLLIHYADGLLCDDGLSHPAILALAGQHLADLVVLAFGTDRDNTEVARMRGLRAARLDAALRAIRASYDDPGMTPGTVAARIGISSRYLHKLLHETGASFAERVQELRLIKAVALLSNQEGGARKISEVAYAAGFSDLSNFNRLFRRRYGLTPSAARGHGVSLPD